jgi:putative hydrolase of the HAD superfamily
MTPRTDACQPDLGKWWATHCSFSKYLSPDPEFIAAIQSLPPSIKKVIFTNAPREYALQTLEALGLLECFNSDCVFGVEDVMPVCKPEVFL